MPPIVKSEIIPTAKSSGVRNSIEPCQSVPIQLKILTPVGTAIRNELIIAKISTTIGSGVVNMWWIHVSSPRKAIRTVDAAIAL